MTVRPRQEHGSAAVLVTVLAGLLVMVAAASTVIAGMLVGHRQAAAAADLAALAGAQALDPAGAGGVGAACGQARVVARANGARLVGCDVMGRDVLVRTSVGVRGLLGLTWDVAGRARAGPPATPVSAPGGRGP